MKVISLQIDVTKIDKERIYEGKKGKYLNAVLFLNEETDQYGNNGFISESVSKEEREKGVKGNILGNAKDLSKGSKKDVDGYPKNSQQKNPSYDDSNDLPF